MSLHLGYTCYYNMMLQATIAKADRPTYDEAEHFTGMFNSIFGTDMSPEYYISSNAESPDEAIESYKHMRDYIDFMTRRLDMDADAIAALYKTLYHTFPERMPCYKVECCTHYRIYAESVIDWAYGGLTDGQLSKRFVHINIISMASREATPREIRNFIRCMLRLEQLYDEIAAKRETRRIRKQRLSQQHAEADA